MNAHIRMRFVAPLRSKTPPQRLTGDISFLPMEAIGDDGTYDRESVRQADEVTNAGYTYFEQGDVVRARVTPCFENGKGALLAALTGGRGVGTTELFVFKPSPRMDPRFLFYVTTSREFTEQGAATLYGAHGVRRVDDQFARDYGVWLPPIDAQQAIADYLDAETTRIDALVEKKRRMIELLEERRAAITVAAVTDPGWPRVKLTLLARLGSGHTPSRGRTDWWESATIPWITTGDVAQIRGDRIEFIEEPKLLISEIGLANSAAELHPVGTVVLSRTASVGFSAIMARPMATSQDFATWTCGPRVQPRFLLLCLRGMRSELLGRLAIGSTHKTIYMPDIEGIRVPMPSPEEQERVVNEVWEQLRSIDAAVDAIGRQINLLNEHRQALITTAVTGKLDIAKGAA